MCIFGKCLFDVHWWDDRLLWPTFSHLTERRSLWLIEHNPQCLSFVCVFHVWNPDEAGSVWSQSFKYILRRKSQRRLTGKYYPKKLLPLNWCTRAVASRGTVSNACVCVCDVWHYWLDGPLHEQWHGQNVRAIWWQWRSWLIARMCETEKHFFSPELLTEWESMQCTCWSVCPCGYWMAVCVCGRECVCVMCLPDGALDSELYRGRRGGEREATLKWCHSVLFLSPPN